MAAADTAIPFPGKTGTDAGPSRHDTSGSGRQGCGQKWKDGGGGPKQQEGQQGQGNLPEETRVYVVERFTEA